MYKLRRYAPLDLRFHPVDSGPGGFHQGGGGGAVVTSAGDRSFGMDS